MTLGSFSSNADVLVNVSTPSGSLVGIANDSCVAFKGVPYAMPPIGSFRWRTTQRMTRWDGKRYALTFGAAPIQELPPKSTLMYRLNNDDRTALIMSEDCLYLNVWSPAPSIDSKLPVLVWIHGGGNKTGHGAQDLFDGARLAARGVVVVTINIRLGALGFLSLPELCAESPEGASGNYGVHDALNALEWVQDNIASLGGDPSRVTLAGNSSGAVIVTHLMAATRALGLFSAAIGQSLSGIFRHDGRMLTQDVASEQGRSFIGSKGYTLNKLRDLPATAFIHTPTQGVIVDGALLSDDTTDVFLEGRQLKIPLLIGWNSDEGSSYASTQSLQDLRIKCVDEHTRKKLETIYPSVFSTEIAPSVRDLVGQRRFAYPAWRWARTHTETSSSKVWIYEFAHSLPLPKDVPKPPDGGGEYGAFHTSELPYTWENLDVRNWDWSDVDRELAKLMADAWTRFVINHDPRDAKKLADWEPLDVSEGNRLKFSGLTTQVGGIQCRDAFDVFDEIFFKQFQDSSSNSENQGIFYGK